MNRDYSPYLLSVLRVVTGFLFAPHGAQKLFGFLPPYEMSFAVGSQAWIAGVLELFGGALFLLGLWTRPVAFILSGMMAVAYFQMHAPGGFWPLQNGGEPAALYCFVFLFFAAAGSGPWSLDGLLKRNQSAKFSHI